MQKRMLSAVISMVLSLVLVITLALQYPCQVNSESTTKYVKDIKIATGTTRTEAISALKDADYTVVNHNLCEGTEGSYCYIGYKTTTDESEAVTDIRLMNAGGGISDVKYRDLVAKWKSGIETSAEYLKEACLEVKANYAKKSPLAQAAVELLNIFEIDGIALSDYLFNSARKDEDYQDILLICADNVVSVIYSALYIGTADYNTDNFAKRLGNLNGELFTYDYIEDQKDNAVYSGYWTDTARIISQLQTFTEQYDEAVEFFQNYTPESDSESSDETEMSEEELCDYWREFVDDYYKNSTDSEEQELYQYASVIGIYEKLKGYTDSFSGAYKNLAEYIYECGNPFDEDGEESDLVYYRIYPLVSALTPGQIFTLQYGGLSALVSALDNNVESYKNQTSAAIDEIKEKIAENGLKRISIFYNVNREVYNQTVAFTDEAHRVATAASSYEALTRVDSPDELTQTLTDIVFIGGMVAGAVLAATVLYLGASALIYGTTAMTLLHVGYIALLSGSIAIASGGMTLTTTAIVSGIIGIGALIVVALVLSVIVICALIQFFKEVFSDDEEEEVEVYPEMPSVIYDVVGTDFTEYNAITDLDGNLVDINGGKGSQWDGLYYTHSVNAGSPIKADDYAFTFSTESYVAPDGYVAVKRFGYVSSANFNTYKKNSDNPFYLFFSSQDGEQDTGNTYLYDLQLLTGDSTDEVRLGLMEKNYTVIEQDLTPNSQEVTYLGYKTTDNASEAITDIRIAYYYNAEKFSYGTTSQGVAAEYAYVGQLDTKASLYYVKQASNGSPILADIIATKELLDASSGYEPVNLFSGGNAFNLMIGSNSYSGINVLKEGLWSKSLYLYFRPSEEYTSGTEYVSGFAFSSDFDDNLDFAAQCGFKPVESLKNYDLTSGLSEQTTHLLYSTTYNPYRAITEIRTYTAQNSCDSMFENIVVGATGYAACEIFTCIKDVGTFSTDYYRLLRPSNSFISRHSYEGGCEIHMDTVYQAVNNLGKYEEIPQIGLFVAGPSPTSKPLTFDDIYFSIDKGDATRTYFDNANGERVYCRPVSDLTDCYTNSAQNLTFERSYYWRGDNEHVRDISLSRYLYIYYRGSVPTRGKYVKNIYVSTVEPEDGNEKYAADQAILKALSYGEGELIKINLSRDESDQPYTTEKIELDNSYYYRDVYSSSSGTASYIFVTYTDYRIESMRSVTRKWYDEDESTESKTLEYQSTSYTRGGDVVKGISGDYGIFTSSNGQLGAAITDVILDTEYLTNGCISISDYDEENRIGEDYILKFSSGGEVGDLYYTDIVVASASSRDAAIKELYQKGCNGFIDQDKNCNGGGDYVYIGYKATGNPDVDGVITGLKIVLSDSPIEYKSEDVWKTLKNKVVNLINRISGKSEDTETDTEDSSGYTRVGGNLNEGVGDGYSYLYVSRSSDANPITNLTTTTIMESSLSTFKEFALYDWTKTENASENSEADTYRLCYRQQSNDWTVNENGELIITTEGDMNDYTDKRMITYSKPGMGGYRTYVNYYPEWCEYGDAITSVVINEGLTRLDDCSFRNCENIESVTIYSKDCVIEEGSIPEDTSILGYAGSTAEEYAVSHGMTFVEITQYSTGTILGNGNILFVVIIAVGLCLVGAGVYVIKIKKKK